MNRMLKNKKGMSLVTVIIVVTVLVLLSTMLMQTVIHSIALTKRHRNVDYAYYAGESAIENWFSVIKKVLDDQTIIDNYPRKLTVSSEDSRNQFADYLIDKVRNSGLLNEQLIDIAGVSPSSLPASTSAAKVSFALTYKLELVEAEFNEATDLMDISIGIKAKSTFTTPNSPFTAGDKMVYAVKTFSVKCPVKKLLESAIWSIGDFYVNGCDNAVVKGDVFTFGSHPKSTLTMRQEWYGGIYANKAKLSIFGNAYSRSFIRTGPYLSAYTDVAGNKRQNDDGSEIWVYKDSIAQCIQAFGKSNKIITLRNAYTFDDIEINGEDSVIAVNGSYFGLSAGGDVQAHDNSSAIVNSAPVHIASLGNGFTPESFRTRVTINGDVLIGGATFKTDDDGNAIGEIENASLAFDKQPDYTIPFYRNFNDEDSDFWREEYHLKLREKFSDGTGTFEGYSNQFQVWDSVDVWNPSAIDEWISNIDNERVYSAGNYGKTIPGVINGFSNYETVANNRLYRNTMSAGYEEDDVLDYKLELEILDHYSLDNIFDNSDELKYDKSHWGGVKEALDTRDFLFGTKGKCEVIKDELLGKVSRYVTREYPGSVGEEWKVSDTTEFDKTLKALNDKYDPLSEYMLNISKGEGSGDKDIDELFQLKKGFSVYAKSAVREPNGGNEYFLVVNANPSVNLKISGSFNGIIFTAGKVVLEGNANVYGSIIAAGGGAYDGDDKFVPKAQIVDDSNVKNLNDGEFAAIKIVSGSGNTAPYIDFFLGMAGGRDDYNKGGLKNVIDEAKKIDSFFIPGSITDVSEEYYYYLNRAARINLLNKFELLGIDLYDIF